MKNLHKKVGVIVLSGLVLVGGGLVSSSSVAHASSVENFQHKSYLKELNDYGERAGFKVVDSNSDEAKKAKNLDEYDYSFNNASELNDYISINGPDFSPGSYYKAILGDLEIVIKVGANGIQDVDQADF